VLNIKLYPFGPLRPATANDLLGRWGGGKPGERFRCYLCGHKFVEGEMWRSVYANGTKDHDGKVGLGNFLVGACCDAPDDVLLAKWRDAHEELDRRFWWAKGGYQ
jgi:hypothetical protein